jgi:uncharacterized membrane protein
VVLRIVRAQPRLFTCIAIGVAVTILTGILTNWTLTTRLLTGWDIGIALYLLLVLHMMKRSDIDRIRYRAAGQDEGRFAILALTVAAALASLAAIFVQLGSSAAANGSRQPINMILASLTILLSWTFIHTIFALHYAHEFYNETATGGLAFSRRRPGARLLGLRLLFLRHRDDIAGIRCGRHQQADPAHRCRPRRRVVRIQCRAPRLDGQPRGERDLS